MRTIALLLLASITLTCRGSEAPSLVGHWSFAYKTEEELLRVVGVTVYNPDGTFHSGMVAASHHPDATFGKASAIEGTWKLEGKTLTSTLTYSSAPEIMPVGTTLTCEIIEMTNEYYHFRMPDGVERREYRLTFRGPQPPDYRVEEEPNQPVSQRRGADAPERG